MPNRSPVPAQSPRRGERGVIAADTDPYITWGRLTGFSDYAHKSAPLINGRSALPVAVQLRPGNTPRQISGLNVPRAYRGAEFAGTYATGVVLLDDLERVTSQVVRLKLGMGLVPDACEPAAIVRNFDAGSLPKAVSNESSDAVVIGIIDHSIAFANRAFRHPETGHTRMFAFWDQSPAPEDSTIRRSGFGYGRAFDANAIRRFVRKWPDDLRLYRMIGYRPCYGRIGHGTHVLDLAAGWPLWPAPKEYLPRAEHSDPPAPDAASKAPIVAVQLPWLPSKDTSGASFCVNVLDALHFIRLNAIRAVGGKALPNIIINLSDGAYAGPHDGSSMLEAAIDDFLQRSGRKIKLVVAAGNAFEEKLHASAALSPRQRITLNWQVPPDDFTGSFLEIWFEGEPEGVQVELHPPIDVGPPARVDSTTTIQTAALTVGGVPVAGAFYVRNSPNASGRSMVLLALAPTRPERCLGRPPAPHGVWKVTVSAGRSGVRFDATIQRDNPALGDFGPRRQSVFIDDPWHSQIAAGGQRIINGRKTLNNTATGRLTTVVGGVYRKGSSPSDEEMSTAAPGNRRPAARSRVVRYSSSGPGSGADGSRVGPDESAISDDSPVLHGRIASGTRSGTTFRMNGTSVAAPIVARRKANEATLMPTTAPINRPTDEDSLRHGRRRVTD